MYKVAIIAAAAALALVGCGNGPDLSAINAERQRPLQRYDIIESLAANDAVVVGASQAGAVVVSADQGRNWTRTALGAASVIGLATCPDESFVGADFDRRVWWADANGGNWKSVKLEKPRVPLAVACDSAGRWWVTGSGAAIAMSSDRGGHWTVTDLHEDTQFTTIQFVDKNHGFVLGEFGHVVATDDGGKRWKKIGRIDGDFYPYAALFKDAKEGWTSGIAGQTLHTADGGRHWAKMENATQAALYRLFLHEGRPYGVGAGGMVARVEGSAWQRVAYPDAAPVFLGAATSLNDKHSAIGVGGPGGLLRVIATDGREGGRS